MAVYTDTRIINVVKFSGTAAVAKIIVVI